MPFKPGKSGNPGGRSTEKLFANAVRAAVNAIDPKTQRRKLELIAEKAADLAVQGESWAVQFVADRLDGKAAQEAMITFEHQSASEMMDEEIARRIAELRARGIGASNGNGQAPLDPSKLN